MLSPATSVPIVRFSHDVSPGRVSLARWRETLERQIVGLSIEPLLAMDRHRSDAVGTVLPGLGVVVSNTSPETVRRTKQLLVDGNDNLRLVILRKSTTPAIAAQFGREVTVESGAAVVLSNSEENSITFPSPLRMLALNMRRSVLRPLLGDFDSVLARPIRREVEALRLLSHYIEGLNADPPLNLDVARLAVAHVYDLAALAMGATRDAAEVAKGRGLRAARLRAIKADTAERLASPDLSVEKAAMRHGVSPRYVQMLFEQEGTTFSQYVIGQRLARAYRLLTDPRFVGRSITSVAFDAGFSDLSYFNRTFRRCYGGTPSEVRAEGAAVALCEYSGVNASKRMP
jgi:AraC-like DNA-binding protein